MTVDPDDSLAIIRDVFARTRFHHVLVVEHGRLQGVVSDRDLLKALSPKLDTAAESASDTATLNKKAHQVMSRRPITLGPDASIHDAIAVFQQHSISCIPVVDEDEAPVGILSWRDILKAIKKPKSPPA